MNHVGLILGSETSRLARSCKDWYQLLELAAVFGVLIADHDGLYDPGEYQDRMVLGLSGMMSEAELHVMRNRLDQGKRVRGPRERVDEGRREAGGGDPAKEAARRRGKTHEFSVPLHRPEPTRVGVPPTSLLYPRWPGRRPCPRSCAAATRSA